MLSSCPSLDMIMSESAWVGGRKGFMFVHIKCELIWFPYCSEALLLFTSQGCLNILSAVRSGSRKCVCGRQERTKMEGKQAGALCSWRWLFQLTGWQVLVRGITKRFTLLGFARNINLAHGKEKKSGTDKELMGSRGVSGNAEEFPRALTRTVRLN